MSFHSQAYIAAIAFSMSGMVCAQPTEPAQRIFSLKDAYGHCIRIAPPSKSNARLSSPSDCGTKNTQLSLGPFGEIKTQGLCLGITAAHPEPGHWPGGVITWSACTGTVNLIWLITAEKRDNSVKIISAMTQHCLTRVTRATHSNAYEMHICKEDAPNQRWQQLMRSSSKRAL